MRIGIDVDDVLFPLNEGFIIHQNRYYGTNLTTFNEYDISGALGCTKDEAVRRYHEYYTTPEFKSTLPLVGSQEAVASLVTKHDLSIVTSRPEFIRDLTLEWLAQHFPGSFNPRKVHFTNRCNFHDQKKRTKESICLEEGIELMIDDAVHYVRGCLSVGIKAILFGDYGWNQLPMGEQNGIIRVRSWQDAIKYIGGLSPKKKLSN